MPTTRTPNPPRPAADPGTTSHPGAHAAVPPGGPRDASEDRAAGAGPRWARRVRVRLPVLLVAVVVMWTLVQGSLVVVLGEDPFDNAHPWVTLLLGVSGSVLTLAVYAWLVRRLEGRRVVELAPRAAVGGVARGMVIGAVMSASVYGVLAALGCFRVTGTGPLDSLATIVGIMSTAAVIEELIFRGVVFRVLETRLGTWAALAVSAALFGLMHLVNNPHATAWVAVAIALEAGVMFAAAYAATRTLWLPIGLHLAWNVLGSAVGASPVGNIDEIPPSPLTSVLEGPAALVGSGYGPEAGIPAVVAGLLVGVAFLVLAARRGNLRPADLRARRAGG